MTDRKYHMYVSFSITKEDTSTVSTTGIADELEHFYWKTQNDIVDILKTVGYEVEDLHAKTFITEDKK